MQASCNTGGRPSPTPRIRRISFGSRDARLSSACLRNCGPYFATRGAIPTAFWRFATSAREEKRSTCPVISFLLVNRTARRHCNLSLIRQLHPPRRSTTRWSSRRSGGPRRDPLAALRGGAQAIQVADSARNHAGYRARRPGHPLPQARVRRPGNHLDRKPAHAGRPHPDRRRGRGRQLGRTVDHVHRARFGRRQGEALPFLWRPQGLGALLRLPPHGAVPSRRICDPDGRHPPNLHPEVGRRAARAVGPDRRACGRPPGFRLDSDPRRAHQDQGAEGRFGVTSPARRVHGLAFAACRLDAGRRQLPPALPDGQQPRPAHRHDEHAGESVRGRGGAAQEAEALGADAHPGAAG